MLDPDAAEDERHAVLQRMRVEAEADAQLRHRAPPAARRGSGCGSPRPAAREGGPTGRAARGPRPCRPQAPARRRCRPGRRRRRCHLRRHPASSTTRSKNSARRLLDAPAGRRADQVDVLAQKLLGLGGRVADRPDEQAPRPQPGEAGERIVVEVRAAPRRARLLDAEKLPGAGVVLAAGREAAEHAHQREPRHAGRRRPRAPTCQSRRRASRRRRRRRSSASKPRGDQLEISGRGHLLQPWVARAPSGPGRRRPRRARRSRSLPRCRPRRPAAGGRRRRPAASAPRRASRGRGWP